MNTFRYLAPFLVLCLAQCSKDDPEASLPAATQTGANTAGCLVDGQAFVAKSYGYDVFSPPIKGVSGGFYSDGTYRMDMNAKIGEQRMRISLCLNGQQVGSYVLNGNPLKNPIPALSHAAYSIRIYNDSETYLTDARHTGTATLTRVDATTGLASGTFSFTAVSDKDSTRTISITNGRFDVKR